jgi:LysR family transcriptional activator of nhaA
MGAWLNYHHLLYFWTVVREGGVAAASRKLSLAQPTVSEQLRQLERSLGVELFLPPHADVRDPHSHAAG